MIRLATRHPQWESRLAETVEAWSGREYQFAWRHDCVAFTLACIEAVSGERLEFQGARPYRSAAGQVRWLKDMGWRDLVDAADCCLGNRIAPLQAMRGDVVSDKSVLGVMTSRGAVAFSEAGMVLMAPRTIKMAWPVGRCDG
jgi:hypothetical protein